MGKVKIADAGRCKNCKEWIPRDIINVIEQHKCPVCGITNPVKPLSIVEAIFGSLALFSGLTVVVCVGIGLILIWLIFVFWVNN